MEEKTDIKAKTIKVDTGVRAQFQGGFKIITKFAIMIDDRCQHFTTVSALDTINASVLL